MHILTEPIANSVLGVHKAKKLPPPTKPRKPKPVLDVAQQETSHLQDSSIVISGRARSCHQGMEQQTVGPPGNHHRSIRYTKTTPNNQVQLEVAPPMAPGIYIRYASYCVTLATWFRCFFQILYSSTTKEGKG